MSETARNTDGQIALQWGAAFLAPTTALIGAALKVFEPPWFVWLAYFTWNALCLIAIAMQSQPRWRAYLEGTLRKGTFTQIYTATTRKGLTWLWSRYCDEPPENAHLPATFRAALTWRLYDTAMLIAVAYPILLLVGWWIAGFDGRLGSVVILEAAPWWPDRIATLGVIAMLGLSGIFRRLAAASRKVFLRKVFGWLAVLAFLFAVAVAGAVAGAGAVPVAGAVAFAFGGAVAIAVAGAVAGAGAGAVAVAGAGAVPVAGAGAGAVAVLDARNRPRRARALVTLALPAAWVALLMFLPWVETGAEAKGIFLFLGVLPLINALFDVVSYAVTLTLMRLGLNSRVPWAYGLADFGIACILFLALGAALTLLITAMNALAGTTLFDLGSLFAGIHTEPHAYWWLYAMVFSTILPTALHGLLSLLGLQGIMPRWSRLPIANLLRDAPGDWTKAAVAPLAVGLIWLIPLAALFVIGWAAWWFASPALEWFGGAYLDALTRLAIRIAAF